MTARPILLTVVCVLATAGLALGVRTSSGSATAAPGAQPRTVVFELFDGPSPGRPSG